MAQASPDRVSLHALEAETAERASEVASLKHELDVVQSKVASLLDKQKHLVNHEDFRHGLAEAAHEMETLKEALKGEAQKREKDIERSTAALHETLLKASAVMRQEFEAHLAASRASPMNVTSARSESFSLDTYIVDDLQQLREEQRRVSLALSALQEVADTKQFSQRVSELCAKLDDTAHKGELLEQDLTTLGHKHRIAELQQSDLQSDMAKLSERLSSTSEEWSTSSIALSAEISKLRLTQIDYRSFAVNGSGEEVSSEGLRVLTEANQALIDKQTEMWQELSRMNQHLEVHDSNAERWAATMADLDETIRNLGTACHASKAEVSELAQRIDSFQEVADSIQKGFTAASSSMTHTTEMVASQREFVEDMATKINTRIDNWCEVSIQQTKELQSQINTRTRRFDLEEHELRQEIDSLKVQLEGQVDNSHRTLASIDLLVDKVSQVQVTSPKMAETNPFLQGNVHPPRSPSSCHRELVFHTHSDTAGSPVSKAFANGKHGTMTTSMTGRAPLKSLSLTSLPIARTESSARSPLHSSRSKSPSEFFRGRGPLSHYAHRSPIMSARPVLTGNTGDDLEESARQAYLSRVPVQLRKAVSEHPTAQPWARQTWVNRLRIAEELVPVLTEAS